MNIPGAVFSYENDTKVITATAPADAMLVVSFYDSRGMIIDGVCVAPGVTKNIEPRGVYTTFSVRTEVMRTEVLAAAHA